MEFIFAKSGNKIVLHKVFLIIILLIVWKTFENLKPENQKSKSIF